MTATWTRHQLSGYRSGQVHSTAVIEPSHTTQVIDGLDLWDLCPVRDRVGNTVRFGDTWPWIALSAPSVGHPEARHDLASLRLISCAADLGSSRTWTDHGPLFPSGAAAGSRQWAGTAAFHQDRLEVQYTAVGGPDATVPHFRQRLYRAGARVEVREHPSGTEIRLHDWSAHAELFAPDPYRYDVADDDQGRPGFIKAFRDPFPFRDPTTGRDHVLFAASMSPAASTTEFNGAVGIAGAKGEGWELLDPLLTADGVNNELERPHLVVRDGRYYLFFSTQGRTFHPDVTGPTGLYGFVSDRLLGGYEPINGHGLVCSNPPEEPFQAYSWLVLDDLTVVSFVDTHSLSLVGGSLPPDADVSTLRRHFGGTVAPSFRLRIHGNQATAIP